MPSKHPSQPVASLKDNDGSKEPTAPEIPELSAPVFDEEESATLPMRQRPSKHPGAGDEGKADDDEE